MVNIKKIITSVTLAIALSLSVVIAGGVVAPNNASAAACAPTTPNAGQSATSVVIPKTADYKIWSRIKAPTTPITRIC